MNNDINPTIGMSRRTLLRRGAIVGGTLVWATPVVQSFPRAAFAGTPKDLSYLALTYTCGTGRNKTTCGVKFDLNDDGSVQACENSSTRMATPGCSYSPPNCGDCSLFVVTPLNGGKVVSVSFKSGTDSSCKFDASKSVGKCGESGCVSGTLSNGGRTITFALCP